MNIFVLNLDHTANAQAHVDRHVVKMITEYNQLLSSAFYYTSIIPEGIYKLTHANHPCAIWTRESLSNWVWLAKLNHALCAEYTYRYGKVHAGELILNDMPLPQLLDKGVTPFAQAMPKQYKNDDAVKAYRDYYWYEKQHLFKWKNRFAPDWLSEYEVNDD